MMSDWECTSDSSASNEEDDRRRVVKTLIKLNELVEKRRAQGFEGLLRLNFVLPFEAVDDHRPPLGEDDLEACGMYEECLDIASYLQWRSFSCCLCPRRSGKIDDHGDTITDCDIE
jgi:hypothetical protein